MKKYKIAQILVVLGAIYFLLMAWLFVLVTKVHADFETTISNGVFESKMNWITPVPKLKKISIPLVEIEQVTLTQEKLKNKDFYSLEFKLANKFNRNSSSTYYISLMNNQYEYAKKIKEEISDALENQKVFKCELFSLDMPEIRKAILMWYASAVTMIIIFIVLLILEKKEKNKIKQSDITEENSPNNINNSIIK